MSHKDILKDCQKFSNISESNHACRHFFLFKKGCVSQAAILLHTKMIHGGFPVHLGAHVSNSQNTCEIPLIGSSLDPDIG